VPDDLRCHVHGAVGADVVAVAPYVLFAVLGTFGTGASPVVYARAITSWFDERRGFALAREKIAS